MKDIIFGDIVGTGAAQGVDVGFAPSKVELYDKDLGYIGYWEDGMNDGEFIVDKAAWDGGAAFDKGIMLRSSNLGIGTTKTAVANIVSTCWVPTAAGAGWAIDTVGAQAAGTALQARVTATLKWAIHALIIDDGGTIVTLTVAADYDTEALAKAAIPATTTLYARLGYLAIYNGTSGNFTSATDDLDTALVTVNYYDQSDNFLLSGGITPIKQNDETYNAMGFALGTSLYVNTVGRKLRYAAYR